MEDLRLSSATEKEAGIFSRFTYNQQKQEYETEILDHDCGPANVFRFQENGRDILVSANREIDEIAMYTLSK